MAVRDLCAIRESNVLCQACQETHKEQAAYAVLAQDDLVLAMTWVNGYLAGRDGAKGAHVFDKDWVVSYMGKLSEICKANSGAMLLTEAAAKP